ncbi:class I SAM-dependent methyltransferase [Spongisporangium articulatum]|uniref:Class I SAM-dependent methyltransferase n=1 Tax=Spongisporangium articulatum TaxID=3362603 RepID=A0ABW8AK54_9ACTN
MDDWLGMNRALWDERAAPHAASPGYAVQKFLDDPEFLSYVVRFDLPRLFDVSGLHGVHLQCHIGTDTLSLHRLGAHMSGLDFSAESITQAQDLAARTGADIEYVVAPVSEALDVLVPASFDFVYTGVGALIWLPDIDDWARTVAGLLKPGGRLFIRDMHPMLLAMESRGLAEPGLRYPYFAQPEPTMWDEEGTYVETDHVFTATRTAEFSHSLGETVTALLGAGMRLTMLQEHDSTPSEALPGFMTRDEHEEYRLSEQPWRLAASFTIQAVKEA